MTGRNPQFASRIGLLLATVGSSVGLGNIYRFPYTVGNNGGAAFILIYLLCVLALGIPIMLSEFVIGRKTQASVSSAFGLFSGNKHWNTAGYLYTVTAFLILGFYSVVAGWTIEYLYQAITVGFQSKSETHFSDLFTEFTEDPVRPIMWTLVSVGLTGFIVFKGVNKGIERSSNILMPILFGLLILLAIYSLTLPGAQAGLQFLFRPDFSKITFTSVLEAMGQAFFSLSVGMGALVTYAAYFKQEIDLRKTALTVAALDTAVAIIAGVIIFPAVFTFGIKPTEGAKLIFVTLPSVFSQMQGGYFVAIAFFLLITISAISSTISLGEVIIAFFTQRFNISRSHATLGSFTLIATIASLSSLSLGIGSNYKLFDKSLFNLLDFTTSNILLPIGGIFIALITGWIGNKKTIYSEIGNPQSLTTRIILLLVKYFCPIAITLIFLAQLDLF